MFARLQMKALLSGMESLERYPRLTRTLLRPLANAPWLRDRLGILIRGFMGATAFEMHDVDLERGRIGVGGVEEIMFGCKVVEQLHEVLASRLPEEEKDAALYELGYNLCRWEVSTALGSGRWAPKVLLPLMVNRTILSDVRSDPLTARFFTKVMDMTSRVITDEGGWGHLEFEVGSRPLRVYLSNSQEAAWLKPSSKPVCHLYAGIVAGYAAAISGVDLQAREVECAAMGAPRCVFEVDA